jgi:hypothetical protein
MNSEAFYRNLASNVDMYNITRVSEYRGALFQMRERGIDIQNRWCTSPTPCPMKRAEVMLGSEKMVVQMRCEKTDVRWKEEGA